ncbi:MAG: NfeD family protein [Clostridiaceae bacterium]|nr:NfeD family protein [Clostridiaceae bacterium]
MADPTMGEITFFLKFFGMTLSGMAGLLMLLSGLIYLMRRLVRHHVSESDLDLIGQEAVVIKSIRPKKSGQIRYSTAEGMKEADAVGTELIKSGSRVLITATERHQFRVRKLAGEDRADAAYAFNKNTESPILVDPAPTLAKATDKTDLPINHPSA